MKKNRMVITLLIFLLAGAVFLAGCGNDSSDPRKTFRVTILNLTANQPFSPIAVILHGDGYAPWAFGQAASLSLEQLSEGGSPNEFVTAADGDPDVLATVSGAAPVGMGVSDMFEVTARRRLNLYVSVATMLVNTNDAFTGINSVMVEDLAVGDSMELYANAMDAGTEGNSEALSDIPGPVAGGEGFNAARDDQDIVTVHPGVLTADDGLLTSILNESHRWDNPVAKITVMRID
jgi:hypothetical protein